MAFINDRLLDRVAYGFSGGPTWATTVVRLVSGRSKRNAERSQPLHRYTAPFQNIEESHHNLVIATYIACLGPVHSFRFKDWKDYRLENVTIGTAVGGAGETMQIIKPYTFGPAGGEYTLNRNITKPVDSTVFTDATPLSVTEDSGGGPTPLSFTCDYTTGILTFTSTIGNIIRVTGDFDVPVHFDEDTSNFEYGNYNALSTEVVLVEDFSA